MKNYLFLSIFLMSSLIGVLNASALENSTATVTAKDVKTFTSWGNLEEIKQVGPFYLSKVPSKKALAEFKKNNVATVLDLRTFKEKDCESMSSALALGMKYKSVEFNKAEPLKKEVIQEIDKIVAENGDRPLLIYCESGSRAAAWLATYLVRTHKASKADALLIARDAGLKSPTLEENLQDYIKTL